MRLAIDARHIESDDRGVRPRGGVGRYVLRLLEQLLLLAPELELRLIVRRSNTRPLFGAEPRCSEVAVADEPNSLFTEFMLPRYAGLAGCDLYHSPFQILPRGLPCPSLVTIHDVMWLDSPALCSAFLPERAYLHALYGGRIRRALRGADHLIAISQATADDLTRCEPGTRHKTSVVWHGVEPGFAPAPPGASDTQALDTATGIAGKEDNEAPLTRELPLLSARTPFVLCIGQGSPYKNHTRAVQAFLQAFADRPEVKLVLVRRFSRRDRELSQLLAHTSSRGRILCLPKVDERTLLRLYQAARVFFFPSLKEGFGMPILEAMACGTPVLTSTAPACAEAAADAALLADPLDTQGLASALRRIFDDDALRTSLVAKGLQRATDFTWQRAARLTLAAYEQVLHEP